MKKVFLALALLFSSLGFASNIETPKWVEKHLSFAFPSDEEGDWEVQEAGYVPVNGKFIQWRNKAHDDDIFMIVRMPLEFFIFQSVQECLNYIEREYSNGSFRILSESENDVILTYEREDSQDLVRYAFFDDKIYIFVRGREVGTFSSDEEDKWFQFLQQIEIR